MRENASILGNLANDFDFGQRPRRPLLLRTLPPPQAAAANLIGAPGALVNGLLRLGP